MSIIDNAMSSTFSAKGHESFVVDYGDGFVMKRPLPVFSSSKKSEWLVKQHFTQEVISDIKNVHNVAYNVPEMVHIKDDEFQLLEERAPGKPLTGAFYRSLSKRQQIEIKNSIVSFIMDMQSVNPVLPAKPYNIAEELKITKLGNIIEYKMPKYFSQESTGYMDNLCNYMSSVTYVAPKVWSHGDLSSGNVLYDAQTSTLSFIDFADAKYHIVDHDIISPLTFDLGIYGGVYSTYVKLHDKKSYDLYGIKSADMRQITKNRLFVILLKRFIKAGDDLHLNAQSDSGEENNAKKVIFMKKIIESLQKYDKKFSK